MLSELLRSCSDLSTTYNFGGRVARSELLRPVTCLAQCQKRKEKRERERERVNYQDKNVRTLTQGPNLS